jgi:hypothetical protein
MRAEHRDQIFDMSQQFGNLYYDTTRRLEQANYRIDTLENTLAASRSPEQ